MASKSLSFSKAWQPQGTQTLIEGLKVPEVREIRVRRRVIECVCNWIPQNDVQQSIMNFIQKELKATLVVILPNEMGTIAADGVVTGEASMPAGDVCSLIFRIEAELRIDINVVNDGK